jgi:hypothetical protein
VRATGLLGANLLIVVVGLGALPLLGVARSWRELLSRCGLAYICGLVIVGIVSAHLALVHVSVGWIGLSVLAAGALVVLVWRLHGTGPIRLARPGWVDLAGLAVFAALVIEYARAFRVAPLNRYDAWAIWALKGHALYAFGWADPAVFAGTSYRFANLDYPLLLPSLEAIDFRAMGAFDTRLLHVQFLLFLVAAVLALVALLRDLVPPVVLWSSVLAVALAPAVFDQLLTAYADIPLALVFGVGVAAIARWLKTDERWSLVLATLCFAGALLTKNEGSLVVFGVYLGLLVVARHRRRAVLTAAAVDVALLVPWRIYVAVHHIHDINYSFLNSFDYGHIHGRAGVGPIAFRTLGNQMVDPGQWGLLVPIAAAIAAVALVTGPRTLPLFAVLWTLVSWLGLSWIYVISHYEYSYYLDSTKERVVASIVLGLAALTPLIAADAWAGVRELRRVRAGGD